MDIRSLPVGQGLTWFKQAIDLGGKNPRAVFGAAALFIASLYALALLMALVLAMVVGAGSAEGAEPDMGVALGVVFPLILLIMLAVPILLGGLMHVIREAEAGRPVRARDVFAPLGQARGRQLALLGLVQLVLAVIGTTIMVSIAGEAYWREYMQVMQQAMQGKTQVMPQPDNAGLLFLVQLLFNYFSYALMLFSIPLMLFSGSSILEALRDSLRASVRNVGANLLAGLLFVGALILASIVMLLVIGLVALVLGKIHALLGSVVAMVLMLGFASVVLVLLVGAAYLAWRDTFGDVAAPPPVPVESSHGIEV